MSPPRQSHWVDLCAAAPVCLHMLLSKYPSYGHCVRFTAGNMGETAVVLCYVVAVQEEQLLRAALRQQQENKKQQAALEQAKHEFQQAQREQVGVRLDMFADLRSQIKEQRKVVERAEVCFVELIYTYMSRFTHSSYCTLDLCAA